MASGPVRDQEANAMIHRPSSLTVMQQALALLRTLLGVVALSGTVAGGYWVYHLWSESQRYERYLYHLLGERRVAEICALQQRRTAEHGVETTLRFQEFRDGGMPLSPLTLTLPGEEVYIDALVTVFDSAAVQSGRAQSLYLFRRIFTERVPPQQGVALYRKAHADHGIPPPYRHETIERRAQRRVWQHLWRLIEDRAYAQTHGVRTHFGQAVYARMAAGRCYSVSLQNHGGLLLEARR
jgi:hypothetical protein